MCSRPGHPEPAVEVIRDADIAGALLSPHRYITEDAFALWQSAASSFGYPPPQRSTCSDLACPGPQCVAARSILPGAPPRAR